MGGLMGAAAMRQASLAGGDGTAPPDKKDKQPAE
jgi:hypothetical protein